MVIKWTLGSPKSRACTPWATLLCPPRGPQPRKPYPAMLAGKATIVTGSTSGIGLGIARILASHGVRDLTLLMHSGWHWPHWHWHC